MPDAAAEPALTLAHLQEIVAAQSALASLNFHLDAFMQNVTERMQRLTRATGAVVELLEGGEMVYRAASGTVAGHVGLRLDAADSLSGRCVLDAEIKLSDDTRCDPQVDAEACRRVGAASMIVMPLFRRGVCVGVLKVLSTRAHAFGPCDVQTLRIMADMLGASLGQQLEVRDLERREDELRRQAQYDPLTGLPNRVLFRDRLERALDRAVRNRTLAGVCYLDLDHFKPVNDTYGHDRGDALLRLFAARTAALLRRSDTLARLGGDEFAMVIEEPPAPDDVRHMAQLAVHAAAQPFDLGGTVVHIGASIGVAVGDGATGPDDLLKRADQALYAAKRAGRGGIALAAAAD